MFASYRENLLISYKNFLFIVEIQLHTTIELIFFSPFDMMHWKTPSQALFLIPRGGWSVNKDRNIEHAYNTKRFTFNWHVYATSWFFFVLFFSGFFDFFLLFCLFLRLFLLLFLFFVLFSVFLFLDFLGFLSFFLFTLNLPLSLSFFFALPFSFVPPSFFIWNFLPFAPFEDLFVKVAWSSTLAFSAVSEPFSCWCSPLPCGCGRP